MAAATGIAAAVTSGPLGPPPTTGAMSASTPATPSSVKTMQHLMNEIDEVKVLVESNTKTLEKIDTGSKKAATNRDRSVEGRTQIRDLTERVVSLQRQMEGMTKESDKNWPMKTFDKTKKSALKTLLTLSTKLNHADKHLEKATGTMPITNAPTTNTQPVPVPVAATEGENTKGISALARLSPFRKKKATTTEVPIATTQTVPTPLKPADETKSATRDEVASNAGEEEEEEGDEDDDDDDVISDRKPVSRKSPRSTKRTEPVVLDKKKTEATNVESEYSDDDDDDDDDDEDDDDGASDNREFLTALEAKASPGVHVNDRNNDGRRSRTPTTPRSSKKPPAIKVDSAPSSSPKPRNTSTISPPPLRKKTPSPKPKRRPEVPKTKKRYDDEDDDDDDDDQDSYFEEDEEELRGLGDTGDHEEVESDREYDEPEAEPNIVNANVHELRTNKYPPGTQFRVIQDLTGVQTGDLTIRKGEVITLVEQRPDEWWLFQNTQTQQQGVVPINLIQPVSTRRSRRRAKPTTSATTLVDAFKANNNIPGGYTPSNLAPLTHLEDYQLWRALVPKMTESNLAFGDLHWRVDTDKIHVQDVTYQKILTIKECVKIPRVKGEQVRVLDRCIRVCLYDGFEIVSNIYTLRAHVPKKVDERSLTEDWSFLPNNINTIIDEQSQLLIRSSRSDPSQHLQLLIELSQWCQSTVTQEKCEIGCGWSMVPLDDDKPPLISDTKSYNELLHGGHTDETNVLLDPKYKVLRSDGLSGMIDRFKRARIKFSIESRETDIDLLYDNLPIHSVIVPINLIETLAFFRNELAYQLHKRHHPTGLSTTPIDSIFLATFFQILSQPDLIYTLRRLYSSRRRRYLNSSASSQQQREEFIKTYDLFIYPLLHYRQLPPYDFHDITALNERRKLINEMIKRQLPAKKKIQQDILSILLDPNLTDKWTPFTTNEICFTLQKYIHDYAPDIVA